jgi:hypothetical protein
MDRRSRRGCALEGEVKALHLNQRDLQGGRLPRRRSGSPTPLPAPGSNIERTRFGDKLGANGPEDAKGASVDDDLPLANAISEAVGGLTLAVFPGQADGIRTNLQRRDSSFELNCECLECLSSNSQDALTVLSEPSRSLYPITFLYPITLMYLPKLPL